MVRNVFTFSEKLGVCVEINGCYDFHDRNVWETMTLCANRCHVNAPDVPDMSNYDIALGNSFIYEPTNLYLKGAFSQILAYFEVCH
ncbi:hypothetical protein DPMN_062682 [Dreissena polymorpha]|uniref:Uncharacterized protein n=1 Tax=Dreissena polymorpha TaxID=45954 RepID=A0A9D4HIC5_DREPO|nr:hypothetical protein DPMN_062682 [Dreissena polymorpha]